MRIFILLFLHATLSAGTFHIGPESYYLKRTKDGGTKQSGPVFGIRAGYDRIKPWGFYLGLDGHYAQGVLKGHNASGARLKSTFTDAFAEARVGYTLWALTPFVGAGYLVEKNQCTAPSPLPIHFKMRYPYAAVGFLSKIHPHVGLNFKIKWPLSQKCRVSNDPDPEFSPFTQRAISRLHYRLDIPITYKCFALTAFFEHRLYGRHVNFPCDFIKTNLGMYGLALDWRY